MKKILCIMTVLLLAIGTTDAYSQGWLEELGKKAKKRAKEKVEEKINKKVDDTVDKALESAEEAMKKKEKQQKDSIQKKETGKTPLPKNAEMAYAKSDFVRGDVIIFEDLMDDEQLGEFPSMWDLKEGSAEVASINGKKAIFRSDKEEGTYTVAPLMKNPNNYLPEKYTIEMDLWMGVVKDRTAEGNESEY